MSKYKVIFHIDEMNKWNLLLANVKNLINGFNGENLLIEVLANSEAVNFYILNEVIDEQINTIKRLHEIGVDFKACNNSLITSGIKKESLIDFINIVPSGVVELVKKQTEGYSYIKP